jgi:hypothetical protein
MSHLKTAVLLFEAVVCLLVLILLLPIAGMFGFIGTSSWAISALLSIWVPVAGGLGIYGLYRIMKSVLVPGSHTPSALFLRISLLAGFSSLVPTFVHLFAVYPEARSSIWFAGLFSAHYAYLGRHLLLTGAANKTMKPTR